MKLFFDENLSRKLALRLSELYPDSKHVSEAGLLPSPDTEYGAMQNERFFDSNYGRGFLRPCVVWAAA